MHLDFLDRDHEVGLLACHVLALVVGRKLQWKRLRFAGLHTAHGLVEGLEHLPLADQKLESLGLAAIERHAIDLAFKVNRHAVALGGGITLRALRESAALLAQDVDGFVDRSIGHFGRHAFHLSGAQVGQLDVRIHLEGGIERHLAFRRPFLLADARRTGHAQLGFRHGLREYLTHLVVHDLVVH